MTTEKGAGVGLEDADLFECKMSDEQLCSILYVKSNLVKTHLGATTVCKTKSVNFMLKLFQAQGRPSSIKVTSPS